MGTSQGFRIGADWGSKPESFCSWLHKPSLSGLLLHQQQAILGGSGESHMWLVWAACLRRTQKSGLAPTDQFKVWPPPLLTGAHFSRNSRSRLRNSNPRKHPEDFDIGHFTFGFVTWERKPGKGQLSHERTFWPSTSFQTEKFSWNTLNRKRELFSPKTLKTLGFYKRPPYPMYHQNFEKLCILRKCTVVYFVYCTTLPPAIAAPMHILNPLRLILKMQLWIIIIIVILIPICPICPPCQGACLYSVDNWEIHLVEWAQS